MVLFIPCLATLTRYVAGGVSEVPLLSSLTCAVSARDVMLTHGGGDGL